jgi:hypothetical protein
MSEHVRPKSEVQTFFSDKFLDRDNVNSLFNNLGITNYCRLFWDFYHITTDDWPKTFGIANFIGELKNGMMGMILAETKEGFLFHQDRAKTAVQHQPALSEKIDHWVKDHKFWAKYKMLQWKATLGRMGSSPAESNHSSVLNHLGLNFEKPEEQIKSLLQRNMRMLGLANQELASRYMGFQGEKVKWKNKNMPEDIKAKFELTPWAEELWKEEWLASKDWMKEVAGNCVKIWHRLSPQRVESYVLPDKCKTCVASKHFLIQCRHNICLSDGKFDSSSFAQRWLLVSKAELAPRQPSSLPEDGNKHGRLSPSALEVEDFGENDGDSQFVEPMEHTAGNSTVQTARSTWMPTFSQLQQQAIQMVTLATQCKKNRELMGAMQQIIDSMKGLEGAGAGRLDEACSLQFDAFRPINQVAQFSQTFTQDSEDELDLSSFAIAKENNGERSNGNFTQRIFSPTAVPQLNAGKRNRMKGLPEIVRNKRQKRVITCGFCCGTGHNRSGCTVMQQLGKHVNVPTEKVALMDNLKQLNFSLEKDVAKPVCDSLPRNVSSLIIHGSTKSEVGTVMVGVSVLTKGNISHSMFPEEEEPHFIEEWVAAEWISTARNHKHTFVSSPTMLINHNSNVELTNQVKNGI